MKEEYIVMDQVIFNNYLLLNNIKKAKNAAENYITSDRGGQIVLKVVGKVSPLGKVVWDSDFEEEGRNVESG